MSTPTPFDPAQHEAHPAICAHANGYEHTAKVDAAGFALFDTECAEVDDDAVALGGVVDLLADVVAALEGLDDQIAQLRQAADDHRAHHELAQAGSTAALAWANARVTLTTLTELLAFEPDEQCPAKQDDPDGLWWHCQRTVGHAGQHVCGDRVWVVQP